MLRPFLFIYLAAMNTIDDVRLVFDETNLFYLNLSLGFIMFGVAINLRLEDFTRILRNPKPVVLGLFSQFILLPFLTFLLVILSKPLPSLALGMFLVAACPGGNISNFMVKMANGNTALSVSLTAFSSTLAVFATPLNMAIWASLYEPTSILLRTVELDFWNLFRTIVIILLIPVVLGMMLRHYRPKIAKRIEPVMHYGSILIFAAIVLLAFKANFHLFLEYVPLVALLVFSHNALALISGYQLARIGKLRVQDRRSISIETGIQNSGLGLILIFTFFDGLGGMAIVTAWWGIWHIVSGVSLASFWSKKAILQSQTS
ncbi:MAG: bile acid:sodium symporter family protein [Bacteroidota bacterium]